ncbi:MAG: GNAT family N-acetyltransferase, partial [Nitratireductor sp.]|nr:GNAT family N-acetyltransferase [Nitratireductor sp.]
LEFGFTTLDLEEIVSFAVHDNHRSTNVMKRLGMVRIEDRDFDHPLVPDTHPHLKRHVFYAMSKARWQKHRK